MPAVNRQAGGFTFYNVFRGKFTIKAPDDYTGPEDVVERVNKEGKAVREIHFNRLEGLLLADIKEEKHDNYGKSYEFFFIDGNKYLKLRVSSKSAVASGILTRLENIAIGEELAIELYFFPKNEERPKDRTTLNIFQGGEKVKRVYTKDNPGKLPPAKAIMKDGEPDLDWTDQLAYWSKVIASFAPPVLPGVHQETAQVAQEQDTTPKKPVQETASPTQQAQSPPLTPGDDEVDDLPF